MDWLFRRVELKDSDLLLQWRNDPLIYRYLFHPSPVAPIDHEKWLNNVVKNNSVLFLIAEYKGTPSGTVRFDFIDDFKETEVGIYLAPEMHGKGKGADMLSAAEHFAATEYQQLRKLIAKVLLVNIASEKMFYKADYKKISAAEDYIQLEKELRK